MPRVRGTHAVRVKREGGHPLLIPTQQTREADSLHAKCWATVCDDGPTMSQHWMNVL